MFKPPYSVHIYQSSTPYTHTHLRTWFIQSRVARVCVERGQADNQTIVVAVAHAGGDGTCMSIPHRQRTGARGQSLMRAKTETEAEK